MFPTPISSIIKLFKKSVHVPTPSRRSEYEIYTEFEKEYPRHCPVRLRAGDGVPVGPCWHFLKDGKTCPQHGVVKGS